MSWGRAIMSWGRVKLLKITYINTINGVLSFAILWAASGWIESADILVVSYTLPKILRIIGLIIFIGSMVGVVRSKFNKIPRKR